MGEERWIVARAWICSACGYHVTVRCRGAVAWKPIAACPSCHDEPAVWVGPADVSMRLVVEDAQFRSVGGDLADGLLDPTSGRADPGRRTALALRCLARSQERAAVETARAEQWSTRRLRAARAANDGVPPSGGGA